MTTLVFSRIREKSAEYKHRYAATISTDPKEAARTKRVLEQSGFSAEKKQGRAPNGALYTLWKLPATKQAAARLLKDSYAMRTRARIDPKIIRTERINAFIIQFDEQNRREKQARARSRHTPERVKADKHHAGRIDKLIDRIGAESRQDMPAMLAWRAIEQGAV